MDIKTLKKELGITNKEIAEIFDLNVSSYSTSTAKKRYEAALCRFYKLIKEQKDITIETSDIEIYNKLDEILALLKSQKEQ